MRLKRLLPTRLPRVPGLALELLHPGRMQRRTGIVVLTLAMLLAIAVGMHAWQINQKLARMESAYATDQSASGHEATPASDEETKAVQDSIDHLALPWGRLFTALENATAEHINLIDVQPNAETGTLQIIAEAPDVYEMLEYVRALSAQALTGVTLTAYEVGNTQDQPVRFTLNAVWRKAP